MKPDLNDGLVIIGFISLLAGVYLLAGLAYTLLAGGFLCLAAGIFGAVRG